MRGRAFPFGAVEDDIGRGGALMKHTDLLSNFHK